VSDFAARVLAWFDEHGRRDLPWQHDINPYRVWVSEIMLQQTQVQTVIPYFERFMSSFPDAASLAGADIDAVLEHWSGLGYYARGRNLHKAAVIIRDEHGGEFPLSFDEVQALPGIGRSTAGAILAIAGQQRHAILDGNVKRVLARHAAIEGWPGQASVANELWGLADERTPDKRVADYTQAIMDLGATVCTRSNQACASCPVSEDCKALANGSVADFPGRKPKKEKPLRQTTMVLALNDGAVYLERRPPAGIWGGLWSFPEVESVDEWCRFAGTHHAREKPAGEIRPDGRRQLQTIRHSFSHYDLDILPVVVRFERAPERAADNESTWYRLGDELPGGIAAPVQKLLDTLREHDVTNH
jgi:A/G-specific adenine glycosylase